VPQSPERPSQPEASLRNATLCEYVHVLISADETRSGTALGVDKRLLAVAKGQDAYRLVRGVGLDWLNRQAQLAYGRDFLALDEGARDTIVQRMATANLNTLPRVFFGRTRADGGFAMITLAMCVASLLFVAAQSRFGVIGFAMLSLQGAQWLADRPTRAQWSLLAPGLPLYLARAFLFNTLPLQSADITP
jgi:hypothetical protein